MKKKIAKKVLKTVELPNVGIPTDTEEIISALTLLQINPGWQIVVQVLNDNIKILEQQILDKIDLITHKELTDIQVEELRLKRSLNIEVRDTPENYIKQLSVERLEKKEEEFDPYFKTNQDINNSSLTS